MRSRHVQTPTRRLLSALLGLALLAQGLLPVGWMPAFAADGMRLVPCSSYWPEEFAAAAKPPASRDAHHAHLPDAPHEQHGAASSHHGSEDEDEQKAASSTCAFAGSPSVAPPVFTPTLQPIFPAGQIERTAGRTFTVGHSLVAPPPPATGPPATA